MFNNKNNPGDLMHKTFLLTILTLSIFSTSIFAEDDSTQACRASIVAAYSAVGINMPADSFSNSNFEDFNISVEDFNALSSTEQEIIYMKVKPIEVVTQGAINTINRYINRYAGTFYEVYMADELTLWRLQRDNMRNCLN
jgi:hypothetical protein